MASSVNISIAMATYNGERFIREQLDSLARQTYFPSELVVTDDGSTDRTLEIIEDFAKTAPFPVRAYRNEQNLGYADNFLKAASLCEGEWIAFCDQDDVWFGNKLARVRQCFEVENAVLVVHSAIVTDEKLDPRGDRLPNITRYSICRPLRNRPWFTPAGFACCFNARLIRNYPWQQRPRDFNSNVQMRKPVQMQPHDHWIYLLANVLGMIVYLPEPLAFYRRHDGALSGSYDRSNLKRLGAITRTGGAHYLFLAEIAQEYAQTFGRLATTSMGEWDKARLLKAEAYFTEFGCWHRERANLHYGVSFTRRVYSFSRLCFMGAYFPSRVQGLGVKALLKDICVLALPTAIYKRMGWAK